MASNSGSFKDPSGCVFCKDDEIYRSIFEPGARDFEAARDAGIYDKLIEAGLLLPHEEVADKHDLAPEGTVYCLTHPRLPMISYPWEWPFSLLKDAALIHLDAMEMLVPQGSGYVMPVLLMCSLMAIVCASSIHYQLVGACQTVHGSDTDSFAHTFWPL